MRRETYDEVFHELPLLGSTPDGWAELAAADLLTFLADHAVCEQQAALFALALVGQYPEDADLVERMTALAAEEVVHLRRVASILHRRGSHPAKRRPNPWVKGLRDRVASGSETIMKVDRLLVGALIEARSCERFTRLAAVLDDGEVERLLADLGPAEARHWRMFHELAARELPADQLEERWQAWLRHEWSLTSKLGKEPTVHG